MKINPDDRRCRYVVCASGSTVWVEERDFETFPLLPSTTEVKSGWTTRREAEREARERGRS